MKAWAVFVGVLVLAAFAAALALRPPPPRPTTAPAEAFSAAHAWPDVVAIAQRPHPIRSPDQARVRDALFVRMADLGLAPRLRPVATDRGELFNLLGVLPGADRSAPAVLLMAHYDSVPAGPGAADDGAGVAAVLETVRALKASGPRRRDVMVLLTDGEEAGLLGAKGFFSADPQRIRIGVTINLEARGDRGRAVMFETQSQGGALIAFLTGHGALSGASSLMPDLYRRLPNTTDLTEALKRGYAGVNFAFFGGFDAYHRPSDTPARLDPASLQHIGDQALAVAKALAAAPALPGRAPDQVYADVLGGPILRYPPAAGWALLAVAVAGVAIAAVHALAEGQASLRGMGGGVLSLLEVLVMLAAALIAAGLLRTQLAAGHVGPLLRHSGEALAGCAALCGGIVLVWLWFGQQRLTPSSLRLGALIMLAVLCALLQALAPLDAFMLAWPLLLAAIAAVLDARFGRAPLVAAPFALMALAQLLYWAGLLYTLVGQQTPFVMAPFAAVAGLLLLPLAPKASPVTAATGAAIALLGLILSLIATRA